MISTKKLDERRAALRNAGVPERFVESLATRRETPLAANVLAWILCALLVAGFASLVFFDLGRQAARLFYAFTEPRLFLMHGQAFEQLFFGLAILALGPAALWVHMAILYKPAKAWPAWNTIASRLRKPQTPRNVQSKAPMRPLLPNAETFDDECAFLDALRRAEMRDGYKFTRFQAVLAGILIVGLGGWGATNYRVITEEAYEVHSLQGTQVHSLNNVTTVRMTCEVKENWPLLKYALVFRSGTVSPLLYFNPSTPGYVIERLGKLDEQLRQRNAPVQRLASSTAAKACVSALAASTKSDPAVLERVVLEAPR